MYIKKEWYLILLLLLLVPSVSALTEEEAYDLVVAQSDLITSTTAIYRMPDLEPGQKRFESFLGTELYDSGPYSYFAFVVDYYSGAPYGHPIHNFFVNKETGYVLKIYGEFPQADENGKIIHYKSVLLEPKIGRLVEYPTAPLLDSGQYVSGNAAGITGYQTAKTGSSCPIICDPYDDRKPPKSFLFYIKGHDSSGVFDNSLIDAKKCKTYDDITVLTPNGGDGYNDLSDIKKKLSELMGKVCCSDKVTIYVAAHGAVLYTISLKDSLDKETKERFETFLGQLLKKYSNPFLNSETGELRDPTEEELKNMGLTREEYRQVFELVSILDDIFYGKEFAGYKLRNLAEYMELLKDKIGIPKWMQEMFADMLDSLKTKAAPELINEHIEGRFELATGAKIKKRHIIDGKKGEIINTNDLINSLKDIKSCYKELILDTCCAGGAAKSVKIPGLSVVAPSEYVDYISIGFSMCQMLEACKGLVPQAWPALTPPQNYYEQCIEALYKCDGKIFEEFVKSGMATKEQIKKQKEFCLRGKNETDVKEQSFVYKHKEVCLCCLNTTSMLTPLEGVDMISVEELEDAARTGDTAVMTEISDEMDVGEGIMAEDVLLQSGLDDEGDLVFSPLGVSNDLVGEAWKYLKKPKLSTMIVSGILVLVLIVSILIALRKKK